MLNVSVQLSDFGLSRWKEYTMTITATRTPQAHTPSHVPPEKWRDSDLRPNETFDVYAFGILIWELLANDLAYGKENLLGNEYTIDNGHCGLA